ncbi:acyl-CoA thioester hydrolase [Parafrankia irregularis]|uniref:Acyl-CoA thioester hydrolase n=1 Tax=Parafrankia irregularis TaxID=795642 RepID=A0A0S4QNA8_9ACTN|nr:MULTISPECIES: thioesterase family protein [Parafrankia]MBE3200274.1 thioesterase family protein [Parafrankia sp. CH37]CUU56526.1 acyl-CoA thioester hydrolase [Parafrankia irregularis]
MTSPTTHALSWELVRQVPSLVEAKVEPEFIDFNGHMNVRYYLDKGAEGADQLCRAVGIDEAYRRDRRMGVFTAEHHLRYLSELQAGDAFSVHARVLDCSDKVTHLMAFLVDQARERLSCTVEIVLVHVGLDDRRPRPFPEDVAAGWDRLVHESRALPWDAPVCGSMGVRR